MLKIFIADEQISYRNQIEKQVSALKKVEIVGSSRIGNSTFSILSSAKPDVLVIELSSTSPNGFLLLDELRTQAAPLKAIIALLHNKEQRSRANSLGATHIIEKQMADRGDEIRIGSLVANALQDEGSGASPAKRSGESSGSGKKTKWAVSESWQPRAIVIASSTGGPSALEEVFKHLNPPLEVPMFIAQHMPEIFTRDLAQRLAKVSRLTVREAILGEDVVSGIVYIAPGNFHMRLKNNGRRVSIVLDQREKLHSVRPAADYLFQTAASIYGKDCLGVVLTGMGSDGAEGAREIKRMGGRVVIQDKESSAVWGMPGSVHALGAFDAVESLEGMAGIIKTSMVRVAT